MAETPNHLAQEPSAVQQAKPKRTRGERMFDGLTYAGINGVGNFVVTILTAYWALRGGGKEHFDKAGEALTKIGVPNNRAKWIKEMLGTSLGGWTMVIPVYLAEHFHKPLVSWFNQKFGNEEDKKAEIVHPPKQTWGSLLKGRLGAMLTVTAGFGIANEIFSESFRTYERNFSKKFCKVFSKFAERNPAKAAHYGEMAALDVFATTSSAILMYAFSKTFAKKREENKRHCAEHPMNALPASADVAIDAADKPETTIAGGQHAGMISQATPMQSAQL